MVIEKFPYIFKKFVKSSVALVKRNQISTWPIKKSFLNCCYLTNFLAMQKSDFHMTNFLWNEQQFLHGSCGNQISTWAMWKSDFWSLVQLVISRIFWKCMEIYQWPSLILTHTGIGFQIYLSFKENVHGIKAEPPLTLTNKPKKRTYDSKKCQICEKVLSNSRNLNDHMKAVHSDKSDKPFKCTLCSYSTHVKIYLNR